MFNANVSLGGFNLGFGGGVNKTVTTTTSQQVNTSQTIENTIRAQYADKIKAWEAKYDEACGIIKDLNNKLRNSESLIQQNKLKFEEEKKELNFHITRLRGERNEERTKGGSNDGELNSLRLEKAGFAQIRADYDNKLKSLAEQLARFQDEAQKKSEKMAKMENDLLNAQHNLILEEQDDKTYEEKIKMQKEVIAKMQVEIAGWVEENKRDDFQIAQYENQLKQKNDEIALLLKQNEDYKVNISTKIEVNVETTEIYIELEGRFNNILTEKTNLQAQLDIKNALIKDLEIRIKAGNEKNAILYRTIQDLKAHMETYENRELEYKKTIDEYLLQLNAITLEINVKISKITTLESIVKSKDTKINQLTVQVKERDDKILVMKNATVQNNTQLEDTKKLLEQKLKEISEWKQEDERDNKQIADLLEIMNSQSITIKNWEEENRKDDKTISELEANLNYNSELNKKLREIVEELKVKVVDYLGYVNSYSLHDESMTSLSIVKTKTEVEESSLYLSLQEKFNFSEATINNMTEEINVFRNNLNQAVKEKNDALADIETLRLEVADLKKQLEHTASLNVEFELRAQRQLASIETEQSNIHTINTRMESFRGDSVSKKLEIESIFQRIEELN